ncbi:MAG: response regulator [Chloroflexales bacterium]|nr:response regulator [Chloroflexales bacterium]
MPSILIIDDDVTLLARLGLQLEDSGFQVAKSSDLSHGEQLYIERRPDIVILEVRSGNDKGWDLLGRLAAETPVLVLSSAAREEDVVRALEEGAVDHLAKPYRSAELLARIRVRIAVPVMLPAPTPAPGLKASPAEPPSRPQGSAPASPDKATPPAALASPDKATPPAALASPDKATPPAALAGAGTTTPPAASTRGSYVTGSAIPPQDPTPAALSSAPPLRNGAGGEVSNGDASDKRLTSADKATPPAAPASARTTTPATVTANLGTTTPLSTTRRQSRRGPVIDESVFMSEAEEMALLRTPPAPPPQRPAETPVPDIGEGGLGRHMRSERLRRHLTLVQIENELKIRMSYLQAMEDEKFTLLPRGPAASQMVKDYADFLGLDPGQVLDELKAQSLNESAAPLPALGGTPLPRSLPRWAIILLAVLLALLVGLGAILIFDPGFFARLPAFFQGLWAPLAGMFGGG